MENQKPQEPKKPLSDRRWPALVTFLRPFRLVTGPSASPWKADLLDEINGMKWDYVELHKVVGVVDVGLSPYSLVVGRDGALALPPLAELRNDQIAVERFNKCLSALLIGGVYCESVARDGLVFGSIIDGTYLRLTTHSPDAANQFHWRVRMLCAHPFEAAALEEPREISIDEFSSALATGRAVLDNVPEMSGEFLLKGVTGIARRDWGLALLHLWIVVEQITSSIWEKEILRPIRMNTSISGRSKHLSDDRSWTIANKHEMLCQIGVICESTLKNLKEARKARNNLAHDGEHPSEAEAKAAYKATLSLLEITSQGLRIPLKDLDLSDHSLSDPFNPDLSRWKGAKPVAWMAMPKLPGEEELEKQEAAERVRQSNGFGSGDAKDAGETDS